MKMKIICFLLFIWGSAICFAQQSVSSAGGEARGAGGTVSYSVGQVVYITNTSTTGSIAQGVQQPYEISFVSGIEEAKGINLICSAYPNPAADFLTLKVENYNIEYLSYGLYDVNGKLLEHKIIEGNETSINMSILAPASYFLKVTQNNKEIRTFKIVKN
jgi:hypothetical protein